MSDSDGQIGILTNFATLYFEFLEMFNIFKCEIPTKTEFKAYKVVKMIVLDLLKTAKIDFT